MADISKLLDIMARLRHPDTGCPWDLEQDFRSLAPYTIEEAYEAVDAMERNALDELPTELGDLLLQVVFHAQLGSEQGAFDFADIVETICTKMIRRHPHVFGDETTESRASQTRAWDAIKRAERPQHARLLSDVPLGMPGLARAAKLGRRAAGVGFDWPAVPAVRAKLTEELNELDQAFEQGSRERMQAEMGDVLFALVNLCRHLDLDPEQCIRGANRRFERRFAHVEDAVNGSGGDWSQHDLVMLEALWQAAKSSEASAEGSSKSDSTER